MELEARPNWNPDHLMFGPFVLSVTERQLFRSGAPVRIGGRSLDILIALSARAGDVVEKHELIAQVWNGVTVDEGALRVHIAGLRKSLRDGHDGARYIVNVPGRGYSFVAPLWSEADPTNSDAVAQRRSSLPPASQRMIGRNAEVQLLVEQLKRSGFVSLIGPGGIGKTTVVVEALHRLSGELGDEIHFVNLSAVMDPQMVHLTVASMLGVGSGVGNVLAELIAFLRKQRCLLVLDSCEHLIEPVAALAEAIRAQAPLTLLLTTSREPIRAEGEHIVHLPPLECPPLGVRLTTSECLAYPAAELFVERVVAADAAFQLLDADVAIVADICSRLDGIALALELCAGRVQAYGLKGAADLLERRLGLLWHGRRTAPPRQQTLQATLDWSHGLLDPVEQIVLARLSIFASTFSLNAAEIVAADATIDHAQVIEIVASLVGKSLISPVPGSVGPRYRLLDTTRTYALEKLAEHSDWRDVARRHAEFVAGHLQEPKLEAGECTRRFIACLSDVRSALEWCFAKGGDTSVGVRLASVAASQFLENALCAECYRWTALAISNLSDAQRGAPQELELQTALGWSAMFSTGKGEAVRGAFLRGLEVAERGANLTQQLKLLNGLSFVLSRECNHMGGLELAERAAEVAHQTLDPATIELSDWALGVSHHLCGHQGQVLALCESALKPAPKSPDARRTADYGYDYRGRALIARARALWLQGQQREAVAAARFAIAEVDELSHPISIFVVLVYAATVFIWADEWTEARDTIERLRTHSRTQGLVYRDIGAALQAMLNCRRRANKSDFVALKQSLEKLVEERHLILVPLCRTVLADALLAAGKADDAGEIIDPALYDLKPQVDGPEILRVKGAVMVTQGNRHEGIEYLRRAVLLAREQGALAWELRAALSLVLMADDERLESALDDLARAYGQYTKDPGNDDYRAAKRLLENSGAQSMPDSRVA